MLSTTSALVLSFLLGSAPPPPASGGPTAWSTASVAIQGVETLREKRSGVEFPVQLAPVSAPSDTPAHRLAGFGLRTKTIFGVKVYAMALYVDPATTLTALAPWKGKEIEVIQDDSRVYEVLLKPSSGKSLRLVMRRDVDADDMRDAFEDALEPRVKRAAKEFNMPGGIEALRVFRTFFDLDELEKNQILDFSWTPATATGPGRLTTRVGGVTKPAIENPALAWALFDVYLGGDPIHTSEKPKMIKRLAKLLGS